MRSTRNVSPYDVRNRQDRHVRAELHDQSDR